MVSLYEEIKIDRENDYSRGIIVYYTDN